MKHSKMNEWNFLSEKFWIFNWRKFSAIQQLMWDDQHSCRWHFLFLFFYSLVSVCLTLGAWLSVRANDMCAHAAAQIKAEENSRSSINTAYCHYEYDYYFLFFFGIFVYFCHYIHMKQAFWTENEMKWKVIPTAWCISDFTEFLIELCLAKFPQFLHTPASCMSSSSHWHHYLCIFSLTLFFPLAYCQTIFKLYWTEL